MLFRRTSPSRRLGAILIAGIVLILSSVLPVLAAVGLISFDALPGYRAGDIIVSWETATETDIVCFRVVRSMQPLVQTGAVIATLPNRGSATTGAAYEITDSGLTPGQMYYYWLLELTSAGMQNVLTQEVHAVAPGNPQATRHYYFPVMRHAS